MFRSGGIGTCSRFFHLAHVLVGEPASTSPEHALAAESGRRNDVAERHRDVSSSRSTLLLTRGVPGPWTLPVRTTGRASMTGVDALTVRARVPPPWSSSASTLLLTRGILLGTRVTEFATGALARTPVAAPKTSSSMPVDVVWIT